MNPHRYYCERIDADTCDLTAEESHHARTVMRVREGDPVELFDGRGTAAVATVSRVERESVRVAVTRRCPPAPAPHPVLSLHVAVPKGARQRVLVEKCTELGVNLIEPIIARRSTVKPAASALARWRRYAIEAGKQSRQAWLPRIAPPQAFDHSLDTERIDADISVNLIAFPGANSRPLAAVLGDAALSGDLTHVAVWIGPEGGFTAEELTAALAAGLWPVSLGSAVLRIETAAIAVAATVRLGRMTNGD